VRSENGFDSLPLHPEPGRERLGVRRQPCFEFVTAEEAQVLELRPVRVERAVGDADKDRAQFMFGTNVAELRPVFELEKKGQRTICAEFLAEAPMQRLLDGFARPRVGAAGIGPETRPQRLVRAAALQKDLAFRAEEEYRERTVQRAGACVAVFLRHRADRTIAAVDQNQLFRRTGNDLATLH
jgi:hypothetical protein